MLLTLESVSVEMELVISPVRNFFLLKLVIRQITEQAFHDNIQANFQCSTNSLVFMRQHS
jgi:hypothetical protein